MDTSRAIQISFQYFSIQGHFIIQTREAGTLLTDFPISGQAVLQPGPQLPPVTPVHAVPLKCHGLLCLSLSHVVAGTGMHMRQRQVKVVFDFTSQASTDFSLF